ncbi:hypothetical protein [Aestuariivirga sp.]|uniref:hypothetical protein n=1 Tax=Aestuariivirga sp. TaxID=2650926 RepID=UPI0039E4151F
MNVMNPREMIGGNNPPMAEELRERNPEIFQQMDALADALDLVPAVIANDDDEGAAQDLALKCKKVIKMAKGVHDVEKEPFDKKVKEIKAAFAIPMERVEKVAKAIMERLDVYKEKKAAEERRRREEQARLERERAEELARQAQEAERKRQEAEALRRAEEQRARKAQEERERAERDAREAQERAKRAAEEAARLEAERRERARRDEEDRKLKAQRDAEADARRKAEEEDTRKRIEAARAERAKAEEEARVAREASAKALEERRAAEEAARLAKREEKTAEKTANTQLEDAVRLERRADKLDGAAQQSEADLSRGRGEYGSVGSRATRWTYRILDRDAVPLEALRAYMHPDAIDAAVTRFMNAHRPELGKGRDRDGLLRGVEFYTITETRVA